MDRSGAYAARYVAKNVVAAGLAERCLVQLAYAIGVARPVSVMVETFGTEAVDLTTLHALVEEHFDLRPGAIIRDLELAASYLRGDCRLRALWPQRARLLLGADRPGRRPAARRRLVRQRLANRTAPLREPSGSSGRGAPLRRGAPPAARVSLLIPSHALPPFSYLVPERLAEEVRVGTAVVVPLSGYGRLGIVVGFEEAGDRPLKEIRAVAEEISLPEDLVKLCGWAAGAAALPLHAVLRMALPPGLKTTGLRGSPSRRGLALESGQRGEPYATTALPWAARTSRQPKRPEG